jgi:hypothetical protein
VIHTEQKNEARTELLNELDQRSKKLTRAEKLLSQWLGI